MSVWLVWYFLRLGGHDPGGYERVDAPSDAWIFLFTFIEAGSFDLMGIVREIP